MGKGTSRSKPGWGARRRRRDPARVLLVLGVLALGSGASIAVGATGALAQGATTTSGGAGAGPSGASGGSGTTSSTPAGALEGTGMWIWYVSQSNGGNVQSIIATAKRYRVSTLMIKSSDGSKLWAQFTRQLVGKLHAAGLHVCAWQYVYGTHPYSEAKVGAAAVHRGTDCLLIDAESEYEGKYVQAQHYVRKLRQLIGPSFSVGLASFPYVDFHPSFPYSVFLGPGGAQFNVPQMYWRDIGTTVNTVYAHTYSDNTLYGRVIAPLGEVAGNPPANQIKHFRRLGEAYRAPGESWWDWQGSSARSWQALAAPITPPSQSPPTPVPPTLYRGGKGSLGAGDLVLWAQEHLYSAGYHIMISGVFGSPMQNAVRAFQSAHTLPVTGKVDPSTWAVLLRYPAASVTWTSSGARAARSGAHPASTSNGTRAGSSGAKASAAPSSPGLVLPVPQSAAMPAVGYEIPPHLGAGGH